MLLLWAGYWTPRTEKDKAIHKPDTLTQAKKKYYLSKKSKRRAK
jgi:hypothetical protein